MSIQVGSDGTVQDAIFSSAGPLAELPSGASATWSSSHPEIVSVVQLTNPLRANIHGVGAGTASIRCDVTNSPAAGGTTVTSSLDVQCSDPPPPTVVSGTVTQL